MLDRLPRTKWNYTTAAHLLNRAGFGGTPAEIQALEAMGLEKAVSHLLDYEHILDTTLAPSWARPDPERIEKLRQLREGRKRMRAMTQGERTEFEQKQREIDHYLARVAAERDSQTKPDDDTAEAARLGAPEITAHR